MVMKRKSNCVMTSTWIEKNVQYASTIPKLPRNIRVQEQLLLFSSARIDVFFFFKFTSYVLRVLCAFPGARKRSTNITQTSSNLAKVYNPHVTYV